MRRNGFEARKEPVLEALEAIECRDALVTKKADGSYEEAHGLMRSSSSEIRRSWEPRRCSVVLATEYLRL